MDMYLLFNSFESFCDEYESFPQLAMIVYYKLVNRFNRRGWPEVLACSNARMMLACRIKDEETYIKHRNLLKQYGFIDFTSGKKGSPTQYSLNIYTGLNRGISPSETPSVSPSISPSETPSLSPVPKRKTLILNTKKDIYTVNFELFWAAYPERGYQNSKYQAAKNFANLLKKGNKAEDIIQAAKNYAADCKQEGKTDFFYKASNFVGRDEYFKSYLPEIWQAKTVEDDPEYDGYGIRKAKR